MKLFATITAVLGALVAATSTIGCYLVIFDEPDTPDSLL